MIDVRKERLGIENERDIAPNAAADALVRFDE